MRGKPTSRCGFTDAKAPYGACQRTQTRQRIPAAPRARFCALVGGRGVLIDSRESLSAYTMTLGRFEGFEETRSVGLKFFVFADSGLARAVQGG